MKRTLLFVLALITVGCADTEQSETLSDGSWPTTQRESDEDLFARVDSMLGIQRPSADLFARIDSMLGIQRESDEDVEAVRGYRLAAEQGDAHSQYSLGYMYANGEGVPEDDVEASRWFRLAAEQGYTDAQYWLGIMYAEGDGVPEDDAEAVRWFRLAAEQGDARAQANLAQVHSRGVDPYARMDSIAAAWQKERDERFARMDSIAAEYYRSPVPEPEVGSGEISPGDSASRFVTVMLPKGVSLELPRNWSVLSNGQRRSITRSALDLTGLEDSSTAMRFAANLYDDDGVTMGLLNVRYYPELDVTQAEARALSEVEVQALDASLEEGIRLGAERAGVSITSWAGTAPRNVNGLETFVSEYRRVRISSAGRMLVRLVRVLAAERSFTLTISYAEEHEELLQPMTDRIIASIALDGIVPLSGPQASPSPMNILYGEQWQIALLLSLVLTWGIGLAPPLLIRFVILRRPLGNPAAVGLAGSLYLFNVVLFMALGSQSRTHTGLVLVALASYAILRRGAPRDEKESSRVSHSDGAGLRADGVFLGVWTWRNWKSVPKWSGRVREAVGARVGRLPSLPTYVRHGAPKELE